MIINRTPHPIRVVETRGNRVTVLLELPAAPEEASRSRDQHRQARVTVRSVHAAVLAGNGQAAVPVCSQEWGEITGLPAPARGVFHVVSCVVAAAACCNGRGADDLLVPGELVRDKAGVIIGARALVWAHASLPGLSDAGAA